MFFSGIFLTYHRLHDFESLTKKTQATFENRDMFDTPYFKFKVILQRRQYIIQNILIIQNTVLNFVFRLLSWKRFIFRFRIFIGFSSRRSLRIFFLFEGIIFFIDDLLFLNFLNYILQLKLRGIISLNYDCKQVL